MSSDQLSNCFHEILSGAQYGASLGGGDDLAHLTSAFAATNYLRFARAISAEMEKGKILDWGCGYGQMTLLLRALGLDAEPFEVERRPNIDKIIPFCDVKITYSDIDAPLPYKADTFDAVLSCGTLEHVASQEQSLSELHRVMKQGALLFIYMLPNKWSYTEKIADLLGRSCHPVKFTPRSTREILKKTGFKAKKFSRANALPHNLTGVPQKIRSIYSRLTPALIPVDKLLSATPLINQFCGVLEIVAIKDNGLT